MEMKTYEVENLKSSIGDTAIICSDGLPLIFVEHLDVEAEASSQGLDLEIVTVLAQLLHTLEALIKCPADFFGLWLWVVDVTPLVACGSRQAAAGFLTGINGDETFEVLLEIRQVFTSFAADQLMLLLGSEELVGDGAEEAIACINRCQRLSNAICPFFITRSGEGKTCHLPRKG